MTAGFAGAPVSGRRWPSQAISALCLVLLLLQLSGCASRGEATLSELLVRSTRMARLLRQGELSLSQEQLKDLQGVYLRLEAIPEIQPREVRRARREIARILTAEQNRILAGAGGRGGRAALPRHPAGGVTTSGGAARPGGLRSSGSWVDSGEVDRPAPFPDNAFSLVLEVIGAQLSPPRGS